MDAITWRVGQVMCHWVRVVYLVDFKRLFDNSAPFNSVSKTT